MSYYFCFLLFIVTQSTLCDIDACCKMPEHDGWDCVECKGLHCPRSGRSRQSRIYMHSLLREYKYPSSKICTALLQSFPIELAASLNANDDISEMYMMLSTKCKQRWSALNQPMDKKHIDQERQHRLLVVFNLDKTLLREIEIKPDNIMTLDEVRRFNEYDLALSVIDIFNHSAITIYRRFLMQFLDAFMNLHEQSQFVEFIIFSTNERWVVAYHAIMIELYFNFIFAATIPGLMNEFKFKSILPEVVQHENMQKQLGDVKYDMGMSDVLVLDSDVASWNQYVIGRHLSKAYIVGIEVPRFYDDGLELHGWFETDAFAIRQNDTALWGIGGTILWNMDKIRRYAYRYNVHWYSEFYNNAQGNFIKWIAFDLKSIQSYP